MNAVTPKDQLLADLMGEIPAHRRNVTLDHLAPDADRVIAGAHDRVRGLLHVAAADKDGAAYLALRSVPGVDESVDFSALWTASVANPSRETTLSEVQALPPIGERITHAYPGVELTSEPMPDGSKSINGAYTLYGRGDVAVVSLLGLLRTACGRTPVPDWKMQNDKTDFLRTVFDLHRQGRLKDANDLIESYGQAHGIDVEEMRREMKRDQG